MKTEAILAYHDDGTAAAVSVIEAGMKFTRHFHSNGRISLEFPMAGILVHGLVRQWNETGKLLGSYELNAGCGVAMEWYQNGMLKAQISMIDGIPNGLAQMWDETGNPLPKVYMLNGKLTSKLKYEQACLKNSRLQEPASTVRKSKTRKRNRT